jgi:hypothetical protein
MSVMEMHVVSSKSSPKYALRIHWLIHVLKDEGGIDVGTRESNKVHVQMTVHKKGAIFNAL